MESWWKKEKINSHDVRMSTNVESQFYSDEEDENNNGNDQFEMIINRPFQLILKDFTNDTILYRAFVKNPILLN